MSGIAIVAWIIAAALAVVVLTFCAYEVYWKARRLQADLARLQSVTGELRTLQTDAAAVQQRLSRPAGG